MLDQELAPLLPHRHGPSAPGTVSTATAGNNSTIIQGRDIRF
ncbi:hypothetical protein ABZS79_03880 [Streptomyces griseoloalbus]